LRRKGHEIEITFKGRSEDEEPIRQFYSLSDDIRLISLGNIDGPLRTFSVVQRVLAKTKPDYVITRNPRIAVVVAVLRWNCLLELHQHLRIFRRWTAWRRVFQAVPYATLSVAALTPSIVEELDPIVRRKTRAIELIPSGSRDYHTHVSDPEFDVGYLGTFIPGKGIERLMTIASRLPTLRFVVFGDGTGYEVVLSQLTRLRNVTYRGFVDDRSRRSALASFRIGLAPYSPDGFGRDRLISLDNVSPLKIIEYMSAGKLIIASRNIATERIITHGVDGILCDADDIDSWVLSIKDALENPSDFNRLSHNARKSYLEKYSINSRSEKILTMMAQRN
jgi:glycosyltransferase involved in cell wall biosynthesis